MTKLWLLTSVAASLCVYAWAGFPIVEPTYGMPWPEPELFAQNNRTLLIAAPDQLVFLLTGSVCDTLTTVVARYKAIVAGLATPQQRRRRRGSDAPVPNVSAEMARVEVNLTGECSDDAYPSFGMDESYQLDVLESGIVSGVATVTANTLWGAMRGLETLVQVMFSNGVGGLYINQVTISDRPRYSHRGILLDTSRHFFPVSDITDMLDVMAINKFNVFHWHIVDDQSFPFVSSSYPSLTLGSYTEDMVYSEQDVQDVIEFARLRGIRVIPEFDTPGHTRSWSVGLPGFTTACYGPDGQPDGTTGPVDPSNEDVYLFLSSFLTEVTQRFPDNYTHLGGDEVRFGYDCWLSNPQIVSWMASLNITTPEMIENAYFQRLLDLVADIPGDVQYVVWQDALDNGVQVRPDTIVEVWKGGWQDEMANLTSRDLRVILSSPWYLDYISYGADWHGYYDTEPESFNGTDAQNALVIGGEACLWSEFVDETNLMARLWPRASAVAERLWSPKGTTRSDYTFSRMEEHRCRMIRRGYKVEPANGPGFC